MFGFRKKINKLTERQILIADIEDKYQTWLHHSANFHRELHNIPLHFEHQKTIQTILDSDLPVLKEGDTKEKLEAMKSYCKGRVECCVREAVRAFNDFSATWEDICEIRRKLDSDRIGTRGA